MKKISTKMQQVNDLEKEVMEEINEESIKNAKQQLKLKLIEKENAEQIVRNIETEIKELKLKIAQNLK